MSVELRIVVSKRLWELLQREAEKRQLSIQDLLLLAIEKLLREGV
jgi:hypothetical protein